MVFVFGTLFYFHGSQIYLEIFSPKISGDGDSLMASSTVLERLRTKMEAENGERWYAQNFAVSGNRVRIEVLANLRRRWIYRRLPWKTREKIWLIGGTNDFGLQDRDRVELLLQNLEDYFRVQHERGFQESECFYTDLLPRLAPKDETFETDRQLFNSLVASRLAGLAIVIPSGSNPSLSDPTNLIIYSDGTHLTEKGNEILAEDAFRIMN